MQSVGPLVTSLHETGLDMLSAIGRRAPVIYRAGSRRAPVSRPFASRRQVEDDVEEVDVQEIDPPQRITELRALLKKFASGRSPPVFQLSPCIFCVFWR